MNGPKALLTSRCPKRRGRICLRQTVKQGPEDGHLHVFMSCSQVDWSYETKQLFLVGQPDQSERRTSTDTIRREVPQVKQLPNRFPKKAVLFKTVKQTEDGHLHVFMSSSQVDWSYETKQLFLVGKPDQSERGTSTDTIRGEVPQVNCVTVFPKKRFCLRPLNRRWSFTCIYELFVCRLHLVI